MMKKTIASVGLAAAATAGALLLTGSPASAQTTQAPTRTGVAYVQTSAVAEHHTRDNRDHRDYRDYRDHWGHRWGYDRDYYRSHHHHGNHHVNVDRNRIVISSTNTNIAVND
jgi:hypothetical protein